MSGVYLIVPFANIAIMPALQVKALLTQRRRDFRAKTESAKSISDLKSQEVIV